MRHAHLALVAIAIIPLIADARPKRKAKVNKTASAKLHTNKAAKAHKAGKFDVALAELQAAYEIDPQPKLLFGIGQVQAKLDNCAGAIVSYESYLAATKDAKKQAIVKQAIAACTQKLAAASPPPLIEASPPPAAPNAEASPAVVDTPPPPMLDEPPPAIDEPPPRPVVAPVVVRRDSSPWYADWLGDALVGGGVAAGAVSVVTYLGARSALDDAEGAATLDEYERRVDDAQSKRTLSVIFAGGGVVLLGAGLLRYALRDSGEARAVALTPTSGGGLITWTGGF